MPRQTDEQDDLFGETKNDVCESCGAPVIWRKSRKTGRPLICDKKRAEVVTRAGEVVSGLVPHWATCPDAESWRGRSR